MADVSTKPYFIRAIYEWCSDCGFTPYLSVKVDERTRVPPEHVKNGEIVLNVSLNATRNLTINNELVQFSARFNGVSREVAIPVERVQGIFARENGQGAFFTVDATPQPQGAESPAEENSSSEPPKSPPAGRAKLKLIK
jgi:stringent starvation protein B